MVVVAGAVVPVSVVVAVLVVDGVLMGAVTGVGVIGVVIDPVLVVVTGVPELVAGVLVAVDGERESSSSAWRGSCSCSCPCPPCTRPS